MANAVGMALAELERQAEVDPVRMSPAPMHYDDP